MFPVMVVRIRDLEDEGIAVQVRCTGCGHTLAYRGRNALMGLGDKSMRLRDLQRRLRCGKCRHLGELILTIPQTRIDDQRKTPNAINPMARVGPPLWRWD